MKKIFSQINPVESDNRLLLRDVIQIALKEEPGLEFSVPSLYSLNDWNSFEPTDRRVVSRKFNKLINNKENPLFNDFKYLGKKSNIATYKRC